MNYDTKYFRISNEENPSYKKHTQNTQKPWLP